jgi:CheY-like chemotaxis protein
MPETSSANVNLTNDKVLSVLVVDDEETVCNVVCEILETLGFAAHRAYSAADALTFLEQTTPDLILTDVMMPDIDGLTLIYKIRCATESANVPIIVFSAIATTTDRQAALDAGASAFLAKPFSSRELKEIIRPLLPSFES